MGISCTHLSFNSGIKGLLCFGEGLLIVGLVRSLGLGEGGLLGACVDGAHGGSGRCCEIGHCDCTEVKTAGRREREKEASVAITFAKSPRARVSTTGDF